MRKFIRWTDSFLFPVILFILFIGPSRYYRKLNSLRIKCRKWLITFHLLFVTLNVDILYFGYLHLSRSLDLFFFSFSVFRKNCRGARLKEASEERDQRFCCPTCRSSFSKKGNMLTHYRYECGKEPRYQCPYCGKRDRKSSNTYRHIRTYHGGKKIHANRLYWVARAL